MNMSFGLNVALGVSQKLTPQMQQAIRLLAMSHLELEQEVQSKLDDNPLLERIDDEPYELEEDSLFRQVQYETSILEDWSEEPIDDSFDKLSQDGIDAEAFDTDWDNVYSNEIGLERDSAYQSSQEDFGQSQPTIQDHVRWQMNFEQLSPVDGVIAEYLIDLMDDAGYIRFDSEELCQNLSLQASFYQWPEAITPAKITAVLHKIQKCSPTGVGARDLAECLRLQLKEREQEMNLPYVDEAYMVLGALNCLQTNNIKALMQETELSLLEIKEALALIKSLNPEPVAEFYSECYNQADTVTIPDILVVPCDKKMGGYVKKSLSDDTPADGWQVLLNPDTVPKLHINQEYVRLIKKGDDSADNLYLKEKFTDARLFIRSIQERNNNLLKVATCVVQKQQAFFEMGVHALLPLTLKEIAVEVGLHESTVSRLTTNKTLLTPKGVFELKYFFSSSIDSDDGFVSSTAISAQIRDMIQNENPKKPLSDARITQLLSAQGLNIARRTVTKYREAMGILSSPLRRQKL